MNGFKPDVGAGVNSTRSSSVNLLPGVAMDKDSWSPAVQVGVDIAWTKDAYLNLDLKKFAIRVDAKVGEFKADPLLLGVGLGWRFSVLRFRALGKALPRIGAAGLFCG